MAISKPLRLLLSFSLTALFVWLIFRQVQFTSIRLAFHGANAGWISAALGAFMLGYGCRIERWRTMLLKDNPSLKWRDCAGPLMASFAANNVLPFRAGDVLRTFAFNVRLGTTSGVVVATLLAERLLDLLMVFVFLAVALAFVDVRGFGISTAGSAALVIAAAGMLVLLFYPDLVKPVALAGGRFAARLSPSVGHRLLGEIEKSIFTVRHLTRGRTMVRLVLWSVLAWLAEGCVYWFAAMGLPAIRAPSASWVALPVGTLATLIPSTPGYVGTFDYFIVQVMRDLGNTPAATAAYALLVHALLWVPPTIIGGVYFLSRR